MNASTQNEISTRVLSVEKPTSGLARLDDYMRLATALGPVEGGAPLALLKLLAGAELGIGPVAALMGIHVIKGKVSLGAHLIAGVIRRSGRYDYRLKRLDDAACEVEFLLDGRVAGTSSFTLADAQKAGLTNNDNWRKYPRNMLFARAMSNGARWYCPDVFGGSVYTPEELGGDAPPPPTGEPIDASFEVPVPADETPQPVAAVAPVAPAPERAGVSSPVETAQVDRIAAHVARLGLDWSAINNRLFAKYSKWTVRELTVTQADEVEAALAGVPSKPAAA